jgi:hypothetical protein
MDSIDRHTRTYRGPTLIDALNWFAVDAQEARLRGYEPVEQLSEQSGKQHLLTVTYARIEPTRATPVARRFRRRLAVGAVLVLLTLGGMSGAVANPHAPNSTERPNATAAKALVQEPPGDPTAEPTMEPVP